MDSDPNLEQSPAPGYPYPYASGGQQGNSRRRYILALAIVIILLASVAIAYWLLSKHPTAPSVSSNSNTASRSNAPVVPDNSQTPGTGTNYISNGNDLNLSFSYPSNWTITPPSNSNPSDQPITVTSPLASMTNANGQAVTGKVVVSIRPGSTTLDELSSGRATAGQASAQIAYNKPTSAQHQYPYLTYVHFAGGANPSSSFEEVIITGITSFAKDQTITAGDLSQLDPIISARFYMCSNQTCPTNSAASLSITNDTWLNTQVCMQTLAIFQSLQIN